MCHIGFIIPVNYTDYRGKTYLFHEMKPIIKTSTPILSWNVYSVTVSKSLKFLNIKLCLWQLDLFTCRGNSWNCPYQIEFL